MIPEEEIRGLIERAREIERERERGGEGARVERARPDVEAKTRRLASRISERIDRWVNASDGVLKRVNLGLIPPEMSGFLIWWVEPAPPRGLEIWVDHLEHTVVWMWICGPPLERKQGRWDAGEVEERDVDRLMRMLADHDAWSRGRVPS